VQLQNIYISDDELTTNLLKIYTEITAVL